MRNVLKNNKHLDPKRIQRTREFMEQAVDDCLVHNYEDLIDSLVLPDPDDRHVLATAITERADVIVTFNLKDFPKTALTPYGIEAQHPDEFLSHLIDLHPDQVCLAAKAMRNRLRKPPQTVEDYLMSLAKQKLPQTVAFLADRREFI
jgi:hypothetical protein